MTPLNHPHIYSDDKFEEFIKELPQMKALYNEKEMLLASNKSLAEYNLSQEPVLREAKERLLGRYTEATRLSDEVRTLQAQLESKTGAARPDTLLALLEAANQVKLGISHVVNAVNEVKSYIFAHNKCDKYC